MPRAPKRCSPTCPKPVVAKGKCADHQPARIPWENKRERVFLKSAEWQRQRRRVLYRDNTYYGGCQLAFDGCTKVATQVDHKLPTWYTGQEQVSDDELQGVCKGCHDVKSSYEGVQAKKIKKMRKSG
jgi:5-methylcytosine-specific restriction endonuclease McrA